jgi:DNA-binding CsgD family transcriptional regulator
VRALSDKALLDSWYGSLDIPDLDEMDAALATARESDDQALLIRALVARGCVVIYDVDAARPYFTEAARIARDIGDLWRLSQIHHRQSYAAMMCGDMHGTQSVAKEGRVLAPTIGDHLTSHMCGINVACALTMRGELDAAVTEFRTIATEARTKHDLLSTMTCFMGQAVPLSFQGQSSSARAAVAVALENASEIGDYFESACYPNIALACLAGGDTSAAWEACEAALPTIMQPYNAVNSVWVVHAAWASGEIATASRLADDAVSSTRGPWLSLALSVRARIKIGCDESSRSAEDDLHDALVIAAEGDSPLCIPDIFECLAHLACDAGSHQEAARLLGAAHALQQRMGAVRFKVYNASYEELVSAVRNATGDNDFDAAWAEGAALSSEEAIAYAQRGRGERKRPSSGWDSLTPTELDVVRLVAEGIPNKDIATRLFISPRTVQSHLRHVYHKLGLTSRVQLAQEAARHSVAPK